MDLSQRFSFQRRREKINRNRVSTDLVVEITMMQTINRKSRRTKLVPVTVTRVVRKKRPASEHKLNHVSHPPKELASRKSKKSGAVISPLLTQRNAKSHEQKTQNTVRIRQHDPLKMGDPKINQMDLCPLSESQ